MGTQQMLLMKKLRTTNWRLCAIMRKGLFSSSVSMTITRRSWMELLRLSRSTSPSRVSLLSPSQF